MTSEATRLEQERRALLERLGSTEYSHEPCSCGAEFQAEDDRQHVSKRYPDGSGTDYAVDAAKRWRSTHFHTELAVAVSDEGPKEAT